MFILPSLLSETLNSHIQEQHLERDSWIFYGQKGRHLSQKSVYQIVKTAAKKAKIYKKVHPHTLRHSFATHLVENGYDVASIQSLLGHNSMETTMIYVHMASPTFIKVQSPLDALKPVQSAGKLQDEIQNYVVMGSEKAEFRQVDI